LRENRTTHGDVMTSYKCLKLANRKYAFGFDFTMWIMDVEMY